MKGPTLANYEALLEALKAASAAADRAAAYSIGLVLDGLARDARTDLCHAAARERGRPTPPT